MLRRLSIPLTALSFLLLPIIITLWICGHAYRHPLLIEWDRGNRIDTLWVWSGSFGYRLDRPCTPRSVPAPGRLGCDYWRSWVFQASNAMWSHQPSPRYHYYFVGFHLSRYIDMVSDLYGCMAPCWFLALLTAVLPVRACIRRLPSHVRQRRLRLGLCPTCAYDLRATPTRCPECGQPILPPSVHTLSR